MIKKIVLGIIFATTITSCSTDAENNTDENMDVSLLVGTWSLTDVRFEEDPSNSQLNLADEIVDRLVAEDCFLFTFTFNTDGTALAESSVEFLEVNATPDGLDVPCPTESEVEEATWTLEGDQLTIDNNDGEAETITIEFEDDNTLVITGEDIDADNFGGSEAILTRQ